MSAIKEIALLLPDSLFYGSFLLGIGTLSIQHILFFFSLLESLLAWNGLNKLFGFILGNTPVTCVSKFQSLIYGDIFQSPSANNVSYGVYILTIAASYFIQSIYSLESELEVLDTKHTTVYTISTLFVIPLLYSLFRLWFACDSLSSVFLALFFGGLLGTLIQYQNVNLFGRESINFLGIPLLRNMAANGQPLYICTK